MASDQDKGLVYRTILILAFPSLQLFYLIFDGICFVFQQVCSCIGNLLKLIYKLIDAFIKGSCKSLEKLGFGPAIKYQKIKDSKKRLFKEEKPEPLPYEHEFCRRFFTHTGGVLLGMALYIFVYVVLVKHHSVHSVSVAFLLMLPYLLVLENSHSIRAIMMLCLPIMFTNRGRALVFCCMLAIMCSGPLKNSQRNINELHKSLNCSKQYLILRTDDYVEKNVVTRLMRIEETIKALVDDIRLLGEEIKEKVQEIIKLALIVNRYIMKAIEELKKIVDICNSHTPEYIENCRSGVNNVYRECKRTLRTVGGAFMCEIIRPTGNTYCDSINWSAEFCVISAKVIHYIESSIEERLLAIGNAISNLLYVGIDIEHEYYFHGNKTKSFKKVIREIKFDVERKFWYIHFIVRVFNLITLILVIWITLTATLYHMHYIDDLTYDNMYLDQRLLAIDEHRKRRITSMTASNRVDDGRKKKSTSNTSNEHKQLIALVADSRKLVRSKTREPSNVIFPMTRKHEQQYLRPFGIWMNEMERHKLLIASFVWLIIVSYIAFFVALDFGLYHLIEVINQILNDILFKSDLPLIDVSSKSGTEQKVVHYNRTFLNQLREKNRAGHKMKLMVTNSTLLNGNSSDDSARFNETISGNGLSGMYRRLMDSIEKNIPDDVMILDSLQECLPKSNHPNFRQYKNLVYLALLTFAGVIIEAYALRLRHWIANIYYPKRANKRTMWLYRKILAEKPKYDPERQKDQRSPELLAAEILGYAINYKGR